MVAEEIASEIVALSPEDLTELITMLGGIGRWLQAIGVIVVVWIVFQIINWNLNRKRIKKLNALQNNMERLERKIDRLIKKN